MIALVLAFLAGWVWGDFQAGRMHWHGWYGVAGAAATAESDPATERQNL